MKQLMIAIVVFLCAASYLQGAEITQTTKQTVEKSLRFDQDASAPACKFLCLIREENENKRAEMLSSDQSLNLFFNAQKNGILTLGNKNIGWDTFQKLKQEQQLKIIAVCNQDPYRSCCTGTSNKLFCDYMCTLKCCGFSNQETYFEMLKSLPASIKKDLVVDVSDDGISIVFGSMLLPGTCLSGPAICCELGGCSAFGLIPSAIGAIVAAGIYVAERVRQKFYSKKYYADEDMFE